MEKEKLISALDLGILLCLGALVFVLPFAHTESIRAFALGLPLAFWGGKMILRRRLLLARTPLDVPILLFTLLAGLSLLFAIDVRYSGEEFVGEWLIGVGAFYLAAGNFRRSWMKFILAALLLGNLLMTGYGINQFFQAGGQWGDYRIRARSLHSGFGTFSTYLITVMPYVLSAVFFLKGKWRGWVIALLMLNGVALYLTFSRGAWVALGALLFMAGWLFWSRRWLIVGMTLGLAVFFSWAPENVLWHYTGQQTAGRAETKIETMDARWVLTKFCLEKIAGSPLRMLGFGQRSFFKRYRDFHQEYESKYPGAQLWHAHNTFLNVTLQTGALGLVFFLFLVYKLIRTFFGWSQVETERGRKYFLQATAMMVVVFFIRNLSDDFFQDDAALFFWVLCGMAVSFGRAQKEGA